MAQCAHMNTTYSSSTRSSEPTEPTSTYSQRAFLSLPEASETIGCTRRFLEKRIDDGELSVFRPSKRLVRIQRSEFNRWVESFTSRKGGLGP